MMAISHIPPRASTLYKLNSSGSWQKRYLKFEDLVFSYAHSATSGVTYSCTLENISAVEKRFEQDRLCMVIKVASEERTLLFSSPDESLIKNWIQHLNRATTALWNIRYNESQIKNRPLPRLPVAPIAPPRRDDLRRTLARPNVFDTAVALNEAIEEYAELDSSMRNLHIVPSIDTTLSRSDSLRSEDRAQRRYGVFEVDSIMSADEPDESHETEINYSENHSSCYQTSAHTSIVHSSSDSSDASEAARYEHPELWKYLNRVGNETNRLNGALDLALVSPLPEATANTVSTAIIGYAAYLLEINKMTRPLATNSTTEAIDQLTNEYYKFSNRLLVGMVSNPTDEDQECNAQWELEWEVYELRSIAKDTAAELLKLMALL